MNLLYIALMACVSIFCTTPNVFASMPKSPDNDTWDSQCIYRAPQTSATHGFDEIKSCSDLDTKTFSEIASLIHEMKDSCHQFHFKYPLQNGEQAESFAKVMQIKAQEAHRFVPVISNCQFIEARHLGFSRQIVIKNGPIVQEHVLVEPASDSIIFIEEFDVLPNGAIQPGAFAALNNLIHENGTWYFSGIYLYGDQPTEKQIQDKKMMFRLTYENMIEFLENASVDTVFGQLKP